jgi:hypothetical protein
MNSAGWFTLLVADRATFKIDYPNLQAAYASQQP